MDKIAQFLRGVEWAPEGFGLFFVWTRSVSDAELFLDQLLADPELDSSVARLSAAFSPDDAPDLLIQEALPALYGDDGGPLRCIMAIGAGEPWQRQFRYLFARLNERRELLRATGRKYILIAPDEMRPVVRETAPDLWSVRGGGSLFMYQES